MRFLARAELRIVLIYAAVGGLWIWLSDGAIESMFGTTEAITRAQNLKGWFFIAITSLLLYGLIRAHFRALDERHRALRESYHQTIRGWIRVMDLRHEETRDHTERVAAMTVAFARAAGVDESELDRLWRGALLHDIGKIGIPDQILIKPGKLDDEDWRVMRTHPEIGRRILSEIEFLEPSTDIPWCHHEKWDGTGYPRGLSGTAIPRDARLFAIIDVWDALSHDRVYKQAWPEEKVLDYIREQAGRHFDPALVDVFLDHYPEIRAAGRSEQVAQNP
ncbi:HD domain-containing protein [Wenzhouxiangella sp. XN79A]|uniref:HD-GYP domain-containing protein n=1 Tax=Wenzhouxiangella sp. XN79A TaxID=2724193 RepID=UPI00144AE3AD|nr:HD domain-containing phosphohydrolase [Wenzhouxiangella sp. XN79A]NKI33735.1 HD domain-containing protein [Wenzhouxiangella sp. XN79A]